MLVFVVDLFDSYPVHVHCRKGDKECKYWLDQNIFDLEETMRIICLQGTKEK